MKRFLARLLLAIGVASAFVVLGYVVLLISSKRLNKLDDNRVIYVWGDSQMFTGLNERLLGNLINRKVMTAADHGSGVYDLMANMANVPIGSTCVVSFPEGSFLRNPLTDNNRTGFELGCLLDLYRAGCPLDECMKIANLNKGMIKYKAFRYGHCLFPYSEVLSYPEPLALWRSMFEEDRPWLSWKTKAYSMAIQHLQEKRCQIVMVCFPFEASVEAMAKETANRQMMDSLKLGLVEKYAMKQDTIVLSNDSLLMHDLSHLNEVGARRFTHRIADILQVDTVNNRFVEVIIGQ